MNSKNLMIASSVVMGTAGIAAAFFPQEILSAIDVTPSVVTTVFIQITSALYLGFAAMNWMAKTVLIGGIYARPLAIGNFAHFMIAAISLIKVSTKNTHSQSLWIATIIYSIFAVLFGMVLFTTPRKNHSN